MNELNLCREVLKNVNFSNEKLDLLADIKFSNADLSSAKFSGSYLRKVEFTGATLLQANFFKTIFRDSDFRDTDFAGANLQEASFIDSTFNEKTSFKNVFSLKNSIFIRSDLSKVDLSSNQILEIKICQSTLPRKIKIMNPEIFNRDCDDPEVKKVVPKTKRST